ncbi:peptide chain release factor N(5)-glutamine methyltransferase [Sedimentibacter sp. zth1]|uniref:peptide chain release factor N(5)-glutamine methyltransferase n=1 Tax=Sedimentibacter sp. zth1 TaxID=2816908 RepID=UPI001A916DB8|nr:peptide chain release factor N(5)-glutamine methyltransferase [Sedimentibacter sp. zth1]QSX05307.1 peptide chain release factor N(5)-glutamine methyltransferase [Sedimentibacter sp. zth1]
MVKNSIEHLLKDGMNILEKRDYNNPFLDLQLILMKLLNKDKIYLLIHGDEIVENEIVDKFYKMVRRRNEGYPLQYMLNCQEFMGLDFYVEDGVLIPRPDTEILVEKVIEIVNSTDLNDRRINILDIGTGSGAISLSLAHYLQNACVTAIDISDIAIKVANINMKNLNIQNAEIIKGDLFGSLNINKKFDIIVSNPPYIEKEEIDKLQVEVSKYEPRLALDGGHSGLIYYERIAELLEVYLDKKGKLFFEIGNNQAETVSKILKDKNIFKNIDVIKDLYKNDRVIFAQ